MNVVIKKYRLRRPDQRILWIYKYTLSTATIELFHRKRNIYAYVLTTNNEKNEIIDTWQSIIAFELHKGIKNKRKCLPSISTHLSMPDPRSKQQQKNVWLGKHSPLKKISHLKHSNLDKTFNFVIHFLFKHAHVTPH